jgi:hypothetical protein
MKWALWVLVSLGTLFLAYRRYVAILGRAPTSAYGFGGDFFDLLHASRQIAAGHSPYHANDAAFGIGYVSSAVPAILLLPFHTLGTEVVFQGWTIATLVFLIATAAIVIATEAPPTPFWGRPILFGFAALTALHFWPTTYELYNGQTDTMAVTCLALTALMMTRGRWATSGALVGLAAMVKTWTGLAVVAFLAHRIGGQRARVRALVGWGITIAVAPLLAVILGGGSELSGLIRYTFGARTQHLVNLSVSGAPQALFSRSGVAQPLVVSGTLRVGATIVLAVWVVGLLILSLLRCADLTLGFWHVVACLVLLLPVSHNFYCLYTLPLLWIWSARALKRQRLRTVESVVLASLFVCWLAMSPHWSVYGPLTHALQDEALFFANLAAITASVVGERLVGRRDAGSLTRNDQAKAPLLT